MRSPMPELVLTGEVVHGDHLGRLLGFPTANLRVGPDAVPRFGVYAGRLDGMPAAISVGVRPTFTSTGEPLLEAHVLDFTGDLYGRRVRAELLEFVREEEAFTTSEALVAQIEDDVRVVRELLDGRDRNGLPRVADAAERLARGQMVVLDGSAVGDGSSQLLIAADHADAAAINAMATDARGLVSLAMTDTHCDRLGLGLQAGRRHGSSGRPFTLSIEARHGVTTGISAEDRAVTVAAAIAADATPDAVVVPGHVFPLRAADGGTVERLGAAEAAVDLARLAGTTPAAVLCTILDDDGEVADGIYATAYAERHGLAVLTAVDVLARRRADARGRAMLPAA